MTYLLDTNVVSALRVRGRFPTVEKWAESIPVKEQFICVFTVAEVERGIVKVERTDPANGPMLREWFETRVLPAFADRILPFDVRAARILASYRVPEHAPLDDALIAAIAQAHELTVVTRNTRHFAPLGVSHFNPWPDE